MSVVNLNELEIAYPDRGRDFPLLDWSTHVDSAPVRVYFKDLEQRLIDHIRQWPYVIGCVAWLTSEPILEALATREAVSLIVQKEDFLRPDMGAQSGWANKLHRLYDSLPGGLTRHADLSHTVLCGMSCASDGEIEGVRCVGTLSREKGAHPRSHHKFVVFCVRGEIYNPTEDETTKTLIPKAVWTGSFNFTRNATYSFENALYIEHDEIAERYFQEYAQVAGVSEPLDWFSEWVAPEWRIGT